HACWVHIMETVLILLAVVALASAVTLLLAKPELGGSGRPTRRRGTSHASQPWKRQRQCLPAARLGKRRRSRMRYLRRRHSELNAALRDPGEPADLAGKTRSQVQQWRGRRATIRMDSHRSPGWSEARPPSVGDGNEGQDRTRQQAAAND